MSRSSIHILFFHWVVKCDAYAVSWGRFYLFLFKGIDYYRSWCISPQMVCMYDVYQKKRNMTQPHYRHRWVQKEVAGEQLESVWAIFGESRGHHLVALRSRHELLEQLSWLIKQSGLNYTLILPLRLLFKLPLRQTEGFLKSLFQLMKVDLSVPDHTTLSGRNSSLKVKLKMGGFVGQSTWSSIAQAS